MFEYDSPTEQIFAMDELCLINFKPVTWLDQVAGKSRGFHGGRVRRGPNGKSDFELLLDKKLLYLDSLHDEISKTDRYCFKNAPQGKGGRKANKKSNFIF